eukprot:jgi/Ulvmu1/10011/UM059_0060.1
MSDTESQPAEEESSDSEEYDKLNPAQLAEKLQNLKAIWAGDRASTGESSVAEWLPQHGLAVVRHQRGAMLQRMGFMCRGRLYLTIEELIFLVDRGSMVAVRGAGASSKVLSRQECYCIMDSLGVAMDAFLTYCFLQRTGYVVRRCPCIWTVNDGRLVDVHQHWAASWPDSARICAANSTAAPSADSAEAGTAPEDPSDMRPRTGHGHIAPLPELHSIRARFPESHVACAPALSILKPSTDFSRRSPGTADAHIILGDSTATSVEGHILHGSAVAGRTRVMFAYVLGGDVVFSQGRRQGLPSLWRSSS